MSTTTGFCGGIRKIVYTLVKKVPYENKLWVLIRSAVPQRGTIYVFTFGLNR